jgi:hypothetical protein
MQQQLSQQNEAPKQSVLNHSRGRTTVAAELQFRPTIAINGLQQPPARQVERRELAEKLQDVLQAKTLVSQAAFGAAPRAPTR